MSQIQNTHQGILSTDLVVSLIRTTFEILAIVVKSGAWKLISLEEKEAAMKTSILQPISVFKLWFSKIQGGFIPHLLSSEYFLG